MACGLSPWFVCVASTTVPQEQVPVLVAIARGQGCIADRVMRPSMHSKGLAEALRNVVIPDKRITPSISAIEQLRIDIDGKLR
ncbi:protein of unknown function [Burkholderia multivorans]